MASARYSILNYSEELKKLRLQEGYSQYGLALATGISQQRINMYERGSRSMSREVFSEILQVLGYHLEEKIKKY